MEECPNCGQTIKEEDTVCPFCGTDIETYEKSADEETEEETIEKSGPPTEKEMIESEILDNVIKRVDAYWAEKWREGSDDTRTEPAEKET